MRRLWLLALVIGLAHAQTSIEAGRELYMGACSGCHGATGEGSQGPSLLSGRAGRLSHQAISTIIRKGVTGSSMPDFPLLPTSSVANIAAYVRSLTSPAISAQLPGDPESGRTLFFGDGKCSTCHMLLGQGGHPGPDLSNIGAERSVHQLRESLRKPSARIEHGYRSATAVLPDGSTLRGVARNYNNYSVQILDATGRLHLLERRNLKSLEIPDSSMMPPVTNPEDLLAFLAKQSTRPPTQQ